MSELNTITADLREKVSKEINLISEGMDRYRLFTPFTFSDGDLFNILLKQKGTEWYLTDEGDTFMHLSYKMEERDIARGTRAEIIAGVQEMFNIENRGGELVFHIQDNRFGDALFSFLQAITKISDITYLSRERARSTFYEDFRALMENTIPSKHRNFEWHHPKFDPPANYSADLRVNDRATPLYIFAIESYHKADAATIALLTYEKWGIAGNSIGIYEDQRSIARKSVARFSDVVDKQFSTLYANEDRIGEYIQRSLERQS